MPDYYRDIYRISTDKTYLDLTMLQAFLSTTYWSPGISREKIQTKIDHSLCFGVYENNKQIGFARVVSDFVAIAYIADVFILEPYRGKKLSKWLMQCIMAYPDLQNLRLWMLKTRDAHTLYQQFGFAFSKNPERHMEITRS